MAARGHYGQRYQPYRAASAARGKTRLCRIPACSFFGLQSQDGFCSACYADIHPDWEPPVTHLLRLITPKVARRELPASTNPDAPLVSRVLDSQMQWPLIKQWVKLIAGYAASLGQPHPSD